MRLSTLTNDLGKHKRQLFNFITMASLIKLQCMFLISFWLTHLANRTLTANIRKRRGSKVVIQSPLYMDKNTKPLLFDELRSQGVPVKDNHIYMDSMAFGMGQCCLQCTFQCVNVEEARNFYDQLAVLCPIMVSQQRSRRSTRNYFDMAYIGQQRYLIDGTRAYLRIILIIIILFSWHLLLRIPFCVVIWLIQTLDGTLFRNQSMIELKKRWV